MKCYDNLWVKLLRENNVNLLLYMRYVDDSRNFMRGLRKGVRWVQNRFIFYPNWEKMDQNSNENDESRNLGLILQAMSSVMTFLKFTGECAGDYDDNRLPTLDCALYVHNGKIMHGFL